MSRKRENTAFDCIQCHRPVPPCDNGSFRNHCPYCLYSRHLDEIPGDRMSDCFGLMEPIGLTYHSKKGYQLIHRCLVCGKLQKNIICQYDSVPDDADRLRRLMVL